MKNVFVLNLDGQPIMPCQPAKARKLLREKKAIVVNRLPFTIQLTWQCEGKTQPVTVGIDKGSHQTGFSASSNGEVLIDGVIEHRQDVKEKMESRREHRRSRRNRKWYRAKRFNNRASSKRSGRIPPSIKTNADEVYRTIRKLPLPITRIIVEDVQIDIARLNDPSLEGVQYQQSNRLDENLRLACLIRDGFVCRCCKKKDGKLEAHHIVFRSDGGKNTIENLVALCEKCHDDVHHGKIILDLAGENGFKDRIAQRTMQGKAYLYEQLTTIAPVETVFGYQTSEYRKALKLEKAHHLDALCVATLLDSEVIQPNEDNFHAVTFRASQNRKQYYSQSQKGKGRVRYQVNEELRGFRKGDLVLVRGKWIKRIFSIYSSGRLAFPRVKGEPGSAAPKNCKLIERAKTIMFWPEKPGKTENKK